MSTDYIELLRDPRWQRKRLEIMQRDGWTCRSCGGSGSELQVHHKRYERGKPPWEIDERFLVTLCDECHRTITLLRRKAHDALGEMSIEQLRATVEKLAALGPGGTGGPLKRVLDYCDAERSLILSIATPRAYG